MPATQQVIPLDIDKAIREESFEKLRDRIIKGEISLTARDKNNTALHLIASNPKRTDLLAWILKNRPGIDIEVKSDTDCTPLIDAALAGNICAIKLLVEHGADIQAKTKVSNKTARDVLVRKFPDKVAEYDKIVADYTDKKEAEARSFQRKKAPVPKQQQSSSSLSFLSYLSLGKSSRRHDEKVSLLKKTQ